MIEHHEERVAFYTAKMDGLGAPGDYSGDPVRELDMRREDHKKKASWFAFIIDHIVPNEIYRLTDNQLERMGFVRSRW
jgi:hypothetical protein